VRLAARAATELAEGRSTHTAELVIALRDFIRKVLDLDPFPADLSIPKQGPARLPVARGKSDGKDEQKGGNKGGGTGAGMGMGMGMGVGISGHHDQHDQT
jgi:hypothetical protein